MLRRTFDRAERALGGRLEEMAATRQFTELVLQVFHLQKKLYGAFEAQSRALLHLANLPTRSDVARLNRQLTQLREELRELSARLDDGR